MKFSEVRLQAPQEGLPALIEFYGNRLGVPCDGDELVFGETRLGFVPGPGEPFYHFALLVPGNRFEAALAWAEERVELLPDSETGEKVFPFDFWDAFGTYFLDPAGNIVELVAHTGFDHSEATGPFAARELVGFSELGLVGDTRAMAAQLAGLGLELWDGTLEEPGRLAFVGERGRTLILAPKGRGWMPTHRPAEPHPVDAVLSGPPSGEAQLDGHRIRRR